MSDWQHQSITGVTVFLEGADGRSYRVAMSAEENTLLVLFMRAMHGGSVRVHDPAGANQDKAGEAVST